MLFKMSGKCSIFCGLSTLFIAQSVYLYTAGTAIGAHSPLTNDVQAGFEVFQANNCIACHQLYGLGGYMGPDLTNVASDPEKGPEYARAFIEYGTGRMPDFELGEAEIDSLIQFLHFTAASGQYPPVAPKLNWNGTVDYDETKSTR